MQVNYSTSIPETIQRFDENHVTVNFDVVQTKEAEGENPPEYEYKSVLIPMAQSKRLEVFVEALIRERYSENQEFEAQREREAQPAKFAEYNAFIQSCQTKARQILGL